MNKKKNLTTEETFALAVKNHKENNLQIAENFYNVLTFDLDESKCNSNEDELIEKSEVIFVCLPTPMNLDGSCNIDIVESVIKKINEKSKDKIVVIKSTIPPGTTNNLNSKYENVIVAFNPEFLTERNAIEDYENQLVIIAHMVVPNNNNGSFYSEQVSLVLGLFIY